MTSQDDTRRSPVAKVITRVHDAGGRFIVSGRVITVEPMHLVSDSDRRLLADDSAAAAVLVATRTQQVHDRRLALRAGRLVVRPGVQPGHCCLCHEPTPRRWARCFWCAVAVRVHFNAPLPVSLLDLLPGARPVTRRTVAERDTERTVCHA